ncbi:MAG TPA: outer membrane protein assembly factor BamD [Alphaproteobacteria bacterium]|jgi:outer membrane protein assembly factor BamD|nr:outer membrane protein assembly factor BamD [Alphaproteobacteria bacterium]
MTVCFRSLRARSLRAPLAMLALVFPLALTGCGSEENMLRGDHSVAQLYQSGKDEINAENYGTAAKTFDQVEQQHPYSQWATRAQLMAAYADYLGLRYDDAIDALTRFIELHPGNPHVDYAYYMRAICYYEQIADVRRDQRASEQAYTGFNEVIRRFPDTPYARDARYKLDLTRDHLAAKEMDIGRWYETQGNYIAAVNRFKGVVDRFQTTSHVPEALERLTECYLALGLKPEAQKAAAVLGYNYPNSDYYKQAYGLMTGGEISHGEEKGIFTRVWDSLFY